MGSNQKENAESITNLDIYNILKDVHKSNASIKQQNDEIKLEITSLKTDLTKQIENLKEENKKLDEEVKNLNERLLETERKQKKYNLIVYGLREKNEIEDIETFMKIINDKCEVVCKLNDLRDYHRIGKPSSSSRSRPLLVEFLYQKQIGDIYKNIAKLKGSGISLAKDYTIQEYQSRKILHSHLKKARENGQNARIEKNQLIVNRVYYTAQQLQDTDIFTHQAKPTQQAEVAIGNPSRENRKRTSENRDNNGTVLVKRATRSNKQ